MCWQLSGGGAHIYRVDGASVRPAPSTRMLPHKYTKRIRHATALRALSAPKSCAACIHIDCSKQHASVGHAGSRQMQLNAAASNMATTEARTRLYRSQDWMLVVIMAQPRDCSDQSEAASNNSESEPPERAYDQNAGAAKPQDELPARRCPSIRDHNLFGNGKLSAHKSPRFCLLPPAQPITLACPQVAACPPVAGGSSELGHRGIGQLAEAADAPNFPRHAAAGATASALDERFSEITQRRQRGSAAVLCISPDVVVHTARWTAKPCCAGRLRNGASIWAVRAAMSAL